MTHARFPAASAEHSKGFTLIEALVALAILGACLVPIAAFISTAALRLQQAGDSNARQLATQDILALLETLNPMIEPAGQVAIGDITASWTSRALIAPNDSVRVGTGLAAFSVGLFAVDVVVSAPGATPWFDFSARKVGYRRLPQPEFGSPAQ